MKKWTSLLIIFAVLPVFSETFRLNIKKGDHFITDVSVKQIIIRDVNGQQTQVETETTLTFSFEVLNADKATYTLNMCYLHIGLTTRGVGWQYKYDSDPSVETDTPGSKKMNTFYQNLVGQCVTLTLDRKKGTVKAMAGWNKITRRLANGLEQGTRQERLRVAKMLVSSIKTGMTNGGPDSFFLPIVGKKIDVGNQWQVRNTLPIFSGLTIQRAYHVVEVQPDKVKITTTSSLTTSPTATPLVTNETKIQYSLNGTQKGTFSVNRKSGWITELSANYELEGTLKMIDMGFSIPVRLSGEITITSRRVRATIK